METFIFDEVAFKGPILHFKVKRPISIAGTVYEKIICSIQVNYSNIQIILRLLEFNKYKYEYYYLVPTI